MNELMKDEIQTKYLALHDALGPRKDAEDKTLFDQQHGQIWADCDTELWDRMIKLEAKQTLTLVEQQELAAIKRLLPTSTPIAPPLVFEPPAGTEMAEKVDYIERFLATLYGG